MPIYEYACAACGHQFEEWQKMIGQAGQDLPEVQGQEGREADQPDLLPAEGRRLVLGPLRRPQAERRQGAGVVEGLDQQRGIDRLGLDHQIDQSTKKSEAAA